MPRSVAEIEADIAKVKAEMALRDKYERGFNQPQTKVGWGSYIVSGDRGMLDQYQNRENQWKNMQEQQAYQAAERALQQKFQSEEGQKNRDLQKELARINKEAADNDKAITKAKERDKEMLAAEIAQAEYDDAMAKVDMDKPETITAARKAAIKLNYANKNLPYYADDPATFTVSTDFKEDAPGVAKQKRINSATAYLDTLTAVPSKDWSDEEREGYNERIETLKKDAPDLVKKYQVDISNKGGTKEEITAAMKAAIANAIKNDDPDKLPKGFAKRSFGGVPYVVKKNSDGIWVKVQEWK